MADVLTRPAADPALLFDALIDRGFREFAGVPCSILAPLFNAAAAAPGVSYLPASVEGEAVAAAAGAWLGGGAGVVMLQNSGLGNTVNPLASLLLPYAIPVLFIVSWRGEPGTRDAAHHMPMGAATVPLLELFGVQTIVLREGGDILRGADAAVAAFAERRPVALIVPRGVFATGPGAWGADSHAEATAVRAAGNADMAVSAAAAARVRRFAEGIMPDRRAAVLALLSAAGDEPIVSTTGYASRELAAVASAPQHFYMQGSMGFAAAVALGAARSARRRVWVLDGDGALIMRLGSLATIGAARPGGYVHVVLDNGAYASTGGQPTVSSSVDFAAAALACGYAAAAVCTAGHMLDDAFAWAAGQSGPVLLHVRISPVEGDAAERPGATNDAIAAAFRATLAAAT